MALLLLTLNIPCTVEPSTPSPVASSVVMVYRKVKRYLKFFKGIVSQSLWVTGKRGAMCGDHQASVGAVGTAKGIETGKKEVEMGRLEFCPAPWPPRYHVVVIEIQTTDRPSPVPTC